MNVCKEEDVDRESEGDTSSDHLEIVSDVNEQAMIVDGGLETMRGALL